MNKNQTKNTMKQTSKFVYVLQTCDEWKSQASCRNEFVTTSKKDLASKIIGKITDGTICFSNEELPVEEQIAKFKEYWKKYDCHDEARSISCAWGNKPVSTEINSSLIYANIESWSLNEETR